MCVSVFARVTFGRAYFLCTWVVISTALPITEIYIKPEINFIVFSLFNYADICCEAELRTWILITLCVFFSPIPSELWGKTALFVMFLPLLEHKELLEEKRHDQFVCLLPLIHTALLSSEHLNWIHYSYKFFLLCSWQKNKMKLLCMYHGHSMICAFYHLKLNWYINYGCQHNVMQFKAI